jgi:hypothetical protein
MAHVCSCILQNCSLPYQGVVRLDTKPDLRRQLQDANPCRYADGFQAMPATNAPTPGNPCSAMRSAATSRTMRSGSGDDGSIREHELCDAFAMRNDGVALRANDEADGRSNSKRGARRRPIVIAVNLQVCRCWWEA